MQLKGVNLGGWLVLERWITPSLFEGLHARDEKGFCLESGGKKAEVLENHWRNWIVEDDFKWIAKTGLNAVRIPVGYWVFGDAAPYVGSIQYLDWAMAQAEKYNLKVLVDFHAAPGSQNGKTHSGESLGVHWHENDKNIERSLEVIEKLSQRYCTSPSLWGIEVLNEPSRDISKQILLDHYAKSYKIIREHCGEKTKVLISDAFQPKKWKKEMKHQNVLLDMHLYQCFGSFDKKLSLKQHIRKTEKDWRKTIAKVQKHKPVVVGEWSLALDPATYKNVSQAEKIAAKKAYGQAQLETFADAIGWFYWTYKTESNSDWNFRFCAENNLLPKNF